MNNWKLAVLLALAAALITAGAAMVYLPAGLIAGGGLLGAWSWLCMLEVPDPFQQLERDTAGGDDE